MHRALSTPARVQPQRHGLTRVAGCAAPTRDPTRDPAGYSGNTKFLVERGMRIDPQSSFVSPNLFYTSTREARDFKSKPRDQHS